MIDDPRAGDAGRVALSALPVPPVVPDPLALRAARPGAIRDLVLQTFASSRRDWRRAGGAIRDSIRGARALHSRERRFVGDHLHALVRFDELLSLLLRRAGLQDGGGARHDLAWHLAALVLDSGLLPEDARRAWDGPAIDWTLINQPDRALLGWIVEERPEPLVALAAAASFPAWLVGDLAVAYGIDETAALLRSLNRRAPLTLRANRLLGDRDDLLSRLTTRGVRAEPAQFGPDAIHLLDRVDVFSLAEHQQGRCEVQDEGSQLIAELVDARPGMTVVDACAGAGGKSLALAASMGDQGRIQATDVRPEALRQCLRRARRGGVTCVQAAGTEEDGPLDGPLRNLVGGADRVLVDAPCSGTGALRRTPEARWHLGPQDVRGKPTLQRRLLGRFAPLVRPGGHLIYATCALGHRENDEVVAQFLAESPEFELLPAASIWGEERAALLGGPVLRVGPHRQGTDGFYAAVLRRRSVG